MNKYTICFAATGGLEIVAESEEAALKLFDTEEYQRMALDELLLNSIEVTEVFSDQMLDVTLYCDCTGLYTDEEIEIENLCELAFPVEIVEAWYYQNGSDFIDETARELGIPPEDCTFTQWFSDVYTAEDTMGLVDFARRLGFQAKRYDKEGD